MDSARAAWQGALRFVLFFFFFIAVGTVCGGRLCVSLRG